jgi:hypothetical protein
LTSSSRSCSGRCKRPCGRTLWTVWADNLLARRCGQPCEQDRGRAGDEHRSRRQRDLGADQNNRDALTWGRRPQAHRGLSDLFHSMGCCVTCPPIRHPCCPALLYGYEGGGPLPIIYRGSGLAARASPGPLGSWGRVIIRQPRMEVLHARRTLAAGPRAWVTDRSASGPARCIGGQRGRGHGANRLDRAQAPQGPGDPRMAPVVSASPPRLTTSTAASNPDWRTRPGRRRRVSEITAGFLPAGHSGTGLGRSQCPAMIWRLPDGHPEGRLTIRSGQVPASPSGLWWVTWTVPDWRGDFIRHGPRVYSATAGAHAGATRRRRC